ncbi:Appr-1-p processing enzyme family protein [Trichomonas vaginalis G3]|uniref:Appr-1-p processing enzyme family protein n=1 Tax=Trichomonas vaginalis (strain ATCC PRA-98 / G3) TaxID=412133 RepID=A2DKL5_TRIV3|nr:ADP-D-ribose binding [Trichomonas vaginalis G3]EAY18998.1 Appr-1-p processing enzyme family protein [Trichomonas vaginalis G3]KAI5521209.1 ADP-D-ribose binding [Trichomonas vaginalis G3]|eukprot:XP_001579984.1 Appr-1-p processing enzyme family protein [Trichomonas vaginalis G3]
MSSEHIVTLAELPTWDADGPNVLASHPILPQIYPLKKANNEINKKISVWFKGDSCKLQCDAIVNAANSKLKAGSGICGMIFKAAGNELVDACKKAGYTETGHAALTPAFKLPSKYIIHAVGPKGEQPSELRSTYLSTLNYMDNDKIKSIAFCAISTGKYGYPVEKATHIALMSVREWLEVPENLQKTERIVFVVFNDKDVEVYSQLMHAYFPLEGVKYPPRPRKNKPTSATKPQPTEQKGAADVQNPEVNKVEHEVTKENHENKEPTK